MRMSATAEAIAHRSRSALRLVYWASIAYICFSLLQLVGKVAETVSRVKQRHEGVEFAFAPNFDLSQPAGWTFSGAAFVVPGTSVRFEPATARVADLPVSTIVLQGAGEFVGILTGACIAAAILVLVTWIMQGRPFSRAAVRVLIALAIVVMVGFTASTVLVWQSTQNALTVLYNLPSGDGSGTGLSGGEGGVIFSLTPIYIGLALLGLAAVFRVGSSPEKDTEGLV